MKNNVLGYIGNAGEILVLIGAAFWITGSDFTNYMYALGVILFAIARLAENHPASSITLRRLYVQRKIGVFMLFLSAMLMFFYQYIDGYEIQDYRIQATASAWLLPFAIFVVLELYTAYRIPSEQNKEEKK